MKHHKGIIVTVVVVLVIVIVGLYYVTAIRASDRRSQTTGRTTEQ